MGEVESGAGRDRDALTRDLHFESLSVFNGISEPPQLLDKLGKWMVLLNVAPALPHRSFSWSRPVG
jgi:hypothetical protein